MWRVGGDPSGTLVMPVGDIDRLKSDIWHDLTQALPGMATELGYRRSLAIEAAARRAGTRTEQSQSLRDLLLAELGSIAALPTSATGATPQLIALNRGFNSVGKAVLLAIVLEEHVRRELGYVRVQAAYRRAGCPALLVTLPDATAIIVDTETGRSSSVQARPLGPGKALDVPLTAGDRRNLGWPKTEWVAFAPLREVMLYAILASLQQSLHDAGGYQHLPATRLTPSEFCSTVLRPHFPTLQGIIPP